MAETRYLAALDVIALHELVMLRFGEPPGIVRDAAALESAINRPETAAYYENADLVAQAALLAVGISQAQAFVQGNKRTAYIAARVFLELNGLTYVGEPLALARWLVEIAEDSRNQDLRTSFEDWLRRQMAPSESSMSGES